MFYNYLLILLGSGLGMFLTILVQSEIINRSQKFEAGFAEAFKFYTRTQKGGIYIGILVIFIFMFALPNLVTSNIKQFENFISNIRLWSIGIGVGSQAIGFLVVKKSHEKLKQLDNE